jgi:hypothetical protein
MSSPARPNEPLIGFGLVRAPVAPLHHEPRVSSMQVSQALFGHVVFHLEARGDWHRVQTSHDGYEGWVHAGYVELIVDEAFLALQADPVGDLRDEPGFDEAAVREETARRRGDRPAVGPGGANPRLSLGCTVRAGGRRLHLPLGAWVPDGVDVIGGEAIPLAEQEVRFPRDVQLVEATARRWYEGTSYQWGGVTPWGADCSGFVQSVWGLHGVALPRDAWQQALVGADIGRDLAQLAAGDLLFFSDREDRRVTHVGLMLDPLRMAHLAVGRGGWSVEELTDDDDPYVARLRANFLHARRVA